MCGVLLRELSYAGDAWEASVGAGRRPARMPEPCTVNSTDMGHFTLRVQALAAEVMQRAADVRARPLSDFQPSGTSKLKLARQQQQVSDITNHPLPLVSMFPMLRHAMGGSALARKVASRGVLKASRCDCMALSSLQARQTGFIHWLFEA